MSTLKTIAVEITRNIPAAPAEVFDRWLDPHCPGTPWNEAAKLILDPRLDGLYYWLFINEAGEEKPHYGRFTCFERPAKVQFTWMSLHTRGLESLVTTSFQRQGDGTLLTLRHENLPDDEFGRGHERGWNYFVGKFSHLITSG